MLLSSLGVTSLRLLTVEVLLLQCYCPRRLATASQLTHFRDWIMTATNLRVKIISWLTVSRPVYLDIKYPSETQDQIFITLKQLWVFDMRRPLWREDGSVVYNCSCLSSAQSCLQPMISSGHFVLWVLIQFLRLLFSLVSLLYSIGTDRIENTTSNSSSVITCVSVAAEKCLSSCYQAMAVFFPYHVTILPRSEGCEHVWH
jgi:hypothetical protein